MEGAMEIALLKTPPPNPLPEAEGEKERSLRLRPCRTRSCEAACGFRLPLSASGRGLGGGVVFIRLDVSHLRVENAGYGSLHDARPMKARERAVPFRFRDPFNMSVTRPRLWYLLPF